VKSSSSARETIRELEGKTQSQVRFLVKNPIDFADGCDLILKLQLHSEYTTVCLALLFHGSYCFEAKKMCNIVGNVDA
jgi:hypothetical protein